MKKVFNYLAGIAMMAFCVFGVSACGNDDTPSAPNRPLQWYGEWVYSLYNQREGVLAFEYDNFKNGGSVDAVVYTLSGQNLMNLNTGTVNWDNVTKIVKQEVTGSFTYKDGTLSCTFAQNKNSGTLRYGDDRDLDLVYWNISGADIQLLRHNDKTQAFMDKAEELYKKQNAE